MPIQEITPESEVVGLRSTRLTADEAALISRVFPCAARAALIELRLMLNDDSQAYRTSGKGLIAYDWVALKDAVRYRLGSRNAGRLQVLYDAMVCPVALSLAHLIIPMRGGPIVLAS